MSPDRMMPVIMLTANSAVEYVMESRDKGVTEFFAQPFTADSMYRRLVSVIARPRDFVSVKVYFGPAPRRHPLPFHDIVIAPRRERAWQDVSISGAAAPITQHS